MRRTVILASLVALVPASGLTVVTEPAGGSRSASGYHFSLDGKPFSPETVTVAGRRGELAAGDLIQVDGIWLALGEERQYRFRSATEGVLLEHGDGRTSWVGVRVEPNYGEGPDFVDGMAGLTPDEVHGLWGIRAKTWTRSCATKAAFLDLSRVHLTLGQSASEGHDDLPELPSGLRYLEAMRFVGVEEPPEADKPRLSRGSTRTDLRCAAHLGLAPPPGPSHLAWPTRTPGSAREPASAREP